MINEDALRSAFSDYSEALLGPYQIGHVLYRLTDQVVDVLGIEGAGVSIAEDDRLTFVAATDMRVATVEAHQDADGEGPCHDAYTSGERVPVGDLTTETRWPKYVALAIDQGCRAVAGLPMPAASRRIGALNLYRDQPHDWTTEQLEVGQLLANMASGYVINRTEMDDTRNLVEQLQYALDSRVVIEQAKGIVAAQRDITPDAAFEQLRDRARSTSTRLHDVCQQVVDSAG